MSHVLMRHKVTGHTAMIAAAAVPHARTRGWEDPTFRTKVRKPRPPSRKNPETEPESGRNEE